MALKTRKPTGKPSWPLVLLEGPEKVGKSWAAAEFSASKRVGQTYWIDIGEGAADEYGAIPGARYLVVEHDGTWSSIFGQVQAVRDEARRAADADEPPVVLVVDSMTAEWEMLKDWASERARKSSKNKELLQKDPAAEISVPMNLWNDSTARHRRLMTILMTFPGVVVMTARGGEVVEVKDGKPVEIRRGVTSKIYRVEGHRHLGYDASVWVRLSREQPPLVVAARSVHVKLRPGVDDPKPAPNFSLEWLVFDVLKCDPATAQTRDLRRVQVDAGEVPNRDDQEFDHWNAATVLRIAEADEAELHGPIWKEISAKHEVGFISDKELADLVALCADRKAQIATRAAAESEAVSA